MRKKDMKNKLAILVLMLTSINVMSQNVIPCASDEYLNDIITNTPGILEAQDRFYDETSRDITETQKSYKKGTVRIIPVVFHIIHAYGDENISKAQIEDQMRVINEDFGRTNADASKTRSQFVGRAADMEIEFKLARKDPNGNCTEGITRTYSTLTDGGDDLVKDLIRWDYRKYLNIWIIKRIARDASSEGIVLGYATLPYATSSASDGIVLISSRVGSIGTSSIGNAGRVLTHEIGHWLGLLHPFQNGCGSNCNSTGDRVCDTPPVADPSFGCPTSNNTCNNDSPNEIDMVENYMDYANGSCQNAFTNGQKSLVDNSLSNNSYRGLNVSSATIAATGVNTAPSCGPISDFHTLSRKVVICQGGSLTFVDMAYNGTITDRTWTFEGGSPSISTFQSPTVTYNTPGVYKVSYLVTNASGSNTKLKESFITVISSVSDIKTPFTESFENDQLFKKDWNIIETGAYGWKPNTTKSFGGSSSLQGVIDANTTTNTRYNIYSPSVDMSTLGLSNPIFSFKAAYAQADVTKSELLVLHASIDCGVTWKSVAGYRSNTGLTSVTGLFTNWAPKDASEWKTQTADLSAYSSVKNLILRFELVSQSGNSVFIDDINISRNAVGIKQVFTDEEINIYPNPTNGAFNIEINLKNKNNLSLKLYDALGREVRDLTDNVGTDNNIKVVGLAKGAYYIKADNGNFTAQKRLIVLKD
jgi:PKD repeat protein